MVPADADDVVTVLDRHVQARAVFVVTLEANTGVIMICGPGLGGFKEL